jgi:ElaB/YqjD/DUF883 family membrane-anchored ribosome-binding protein
MSTKANAHPAAAELADRLSQLEEDLYALRDSVRAVAGEKLREVNESAAAACQEQVAKVQAVEQCVKDKILQQPVKSLLIAVGAGFVMGCLWARR